MGNREEGRRWLDQAEADLKTARDCTSDGNFYAATFFAQQAAEKGLKGYLYARGLRAVLTHSVRELLEEAAKYESAFKGFHNYGQELDRHYIGSRYPDFYPQGAPYQYYNEEVAQRCLSYAALILTELTKSFAT